MSSRPGITFDTGALIALEKRDQRMRKRVAQARDVGLTITVPAVVLIEWWRGSDRHQQEILSRFVVEQTSDLIAKAAGAALAKLKDAKAMAVDAAVMASAALRGDVVYTSDVEDLEQLREHFPSVRVLRVSSRDM